MTTTHTPAPWLIQGNTVYALTHAGWRKGVQQFKNRFSASISLDHDFDGEECKANARLIAAAPDLLEALTDLFDADMESVLMGDGKHAQIEAIAKARAAIAKAEYALKLDSNGKLVG